jgi:hypothetical protein
LILGHRLCITYRKYLAGNTGYAQVNPGGAQQHLNECTNGCADFWALLSHKGGAPIPDIGRIMDAGMPACRLAEDLRSYMPEPGTPGLHVLVCRACRHEHLGMVSDQLRSLYQAERVVISTADELVCLPVRRYLAGHPRFTDLNGSTADQHMEVCSHGCKDYWQVLTAHREVPSPSAPPVAKPQLCPESELLETFHPKPGSVAMHLIICDVCRDLHLQLFAGILRQQHTKPEQTVTTN